MINGTLTTSTNQHTIFRFAHCLWLVILVLLQPLRLAAAQSPVVSPNSAILINVAQLAAELEPLVTEACQQARCEVRLSNVPVSIRSPGYSGGLHVQLQHAKVLNHIKRDQLFSEVPHSRPILLRGVARIRHSDGGKTKNLRIAGTIFRTPGLAPMLELSLPAIRPSGKYSASVALVRAALTSSHTGKMSLPARYGKTSAYALKNSRCGAKTQRATSGAARGLSYEAALGASKFTGQATYKVVYVATDFDSDFSEQLDCSSAADCNNKIVSVMNQAAVFYENQLGMTLEVARQFGPTSITNSTDSGVVLDSFIDYNNSNRSTVFDDGVNSGSNLVDVFALYTGREFDEGVIGLAYLDSACRDVDSRYATMEVQRFNSTVDPVTTAHEMGHIFNAEHDAPGVTAIMQATLGGQNPTRFSSTSVSAITNQINNTYASCRQGYSSGVQGEAPPSLQLTTSKTRNGRFTLSVTTSAIRQSACTVSLRAAASSSGTTSGRLIKRFTPTTLKTSMSGTVTRRIAAASAAQSNVYLRAFYSCSDGSPTAKSGVKVLSPNTNTSLTSAKVVRSAWIILLDRAFP
jgi:hypothetical protein